MNHKQQSLLFIDHAPALGGAERSLLLILKHLDRDRWQPHLACASGALVEEAQKLGVTVHQVEMPRLRRSASLPLDWLNAASQLASIARQIDTALLHSNTIRSTFYAAPAAKLAQRPFIWHMRDFWLTEARPTRLAPDRWGKRLLCGLSAQVIVNSKTVANHLPCSGKVSVVHNGIEVERFDPDMDGRIYRGRWGIPEHAPVVGMVGRLRPWKGQKSFLRIAAQVRRTLPTAHFLVIGGDPFQLDDDYAVHLRNLAHELNLDDCVHFAGQLDDVRPALAAMDVFVHPGSPEPFGLVNIEAMAMAKPIVAFAHGALPEIVVNGETGFLVSPGDEQGMVQALAKLLAKPQLVIEMGKVGRKQVEQHFTIQQTVHGIEQVYEQVLSRKG